MNTRRKKIEAISIAVIMVVSIFSGIILTAAFNVNVDSVTEGPETTVTPGQEFTTHYINITCGAANQTKLHNLTIIDNINGTNPASYTAFASISVVNDTGVINSTSSVTEFPVALGLGNYTVAAGDYENLTINVTVNTTSLVDCKTIMPNVSVYVYEDWAAAGTWNQTGYLYGNDTAEESIDTGSLENSSVITYDDKVQTRVDVNSSAGYNINKTSINIAVKNLNTTEEIWIVKNGAIVNGTAMTGNDLDNTGNESARVEIALQEGVYNWSVVTNATDTQNNVITPNWATFTNFTVNMSGVALNVTPDTPALQDDGVAPRTAEENATINVTVVDTFGHKMVFNESDVNTNLSNIELLKHVYTGTVIITKITPAAPVFYPNNTRPVQFNVSDTVAETITLKALDKGGLTTGYADQEFTARIGGVDVYAADGEILADGIDYELVYLQLTDGEDPIPKVGITVEWFVENKGVAEATVVEGTTTNVSGIATLNITKAAVSDKTMTITGREKFTTTEYSDTAEVVTISGEANNTMSRLYVNESTGLTQGTVNTTLNVGVLLKDSSGNLVTSKEVKLDANTTATFANPTPISGSDGWANTTIRLPTDVNVTMVRAITGEGNTSLTPPELNKTVNVTSTPDVVTQIKSVTDIGLKNEFGTSTDITIQLQDTHGNDNTTATADVLITTNNPALGNMTNTTAPIKTVNDNLWCAITAGGSTTFTYTVNSTEPGTATLAVNVTDYDFTDTITITTSGPTGLNLTFNKTLPLVGEGVKAMAQLTGEIGNIAIANVNITFTLRNPSNVLIDVNSTTTNADGIATYNFSETTRGTYTIKARNDDYGHEKINTTIYVGNATQIWIAVNETSPQVNDTITVYAIFKDDVGHNSSSVNGDIVNFLADDSSFDTDAIANGVATATYTQSTAGIVTLDVFYTNATNPYWEGTVPVNSTSVTFGAVAPELMEGDVSDLNSCVDISDAMLIAQHVVGTITLNATQLECADTTDEGDVDISDAMHIAQYTVDPDGSLGVLFELLWNATLDADMLEPVPC